MKLISCFGCITALLAATSASAASNSDLFRGEVLKGLDLIGARANADVVPNDAPGELGADVYLSEGAVNPADTRMFIPTSMYVRMGGGLNLGFATTKASFADVEHESSGSWLTHIGLGWNLSSYVRTEIDFQNSTFTFSDLDDFDANYKTLGGWLYFDLARRYVQTGDITHRRTFVPFIGLGAAAGVYEFQGASGADGFVIAAPRAAAGFSVMFTDLIGVDVMYQYSMLIGNGFGWDVRRGGVDSVSNIMASFRVNF